MLYARFQLATLLPLSLAALAACGETSAPQSRPAASVTAEQGAVFIGAGDIASCDYERDELTAQILDTIPGTVFTTGDNAYDSGTAKEFADCYAPTWGRHKDRTWPTPGNHEYRTQDGAPYYEYFGTRAGPPGLGYYSYDVGEWHIIALNSNISMSEGSDQERWLRADLAGRANQCVLAYWHEPRFSSGAHGNALETIPLWRALYDSAAEIVVNGHDHDYERFAPQTPDEILDQEHGIREFVVGTGGTSLRPPSLIRPNSEARNNEAHGVLKLTLYNGRYDWEFIPIAGDSYRDAGSGTCHGRKPPPARPPTTLDVRVATSIDDAEESATGSVALLSTDLELVHDGSNQTVGLRFAGLAIPRGAIITNAYVQFTVDETGSGAAALSIAAEATDFATPFKYAVRNISARPRTQAAVGWTLPAWSTVGAAGLNERTPNLAAVLQEIVNRRGWTSGNALALIITGIGRRVAEAYDDSPAAPLLHVEFQTLDADRSSVTTNVGTLRADGTSNATITVTLVDGGGAPVVGHEVSLSQTGSSAIGAPSGFSDANGQVAFSVTSTTPETVTFTALDVPTGVRLAQTAQVTFIPPVDAGQSSVTTNQGIVIADGASSATITVTLRDALGVPVAGHEVSLTQTGSSVIGAPSGLSDADGQVTFTVTGTTREPVTYTATDVPTGVTITQTAQVSFKIKTVLSLRISAGPDDAEESAGGIMYLESTDLELVFDYNLQMVGLRFGAVPVPPGATITTAYVQFQTDEISTLPAELIIRGQATDNAPAFSWTIRNITPRPRTTAAVTWAPPGWTIVNEAGPAQRTPDLAAVLQEVVDRPGWTSGNALALIITGAGKRVARAFNGAPHAAPLLQLEFIY